MTASPDQLGFDFFAPSAARSESSPEAPARWSGAPESTAERRQSPPRWGELAAPEGEQAVRLAPPAVGRTALRARTAVLHSRLRDLGLRGVDALVLMRTRSVMVSLIGRTLRVHEGYAEAPESVLRAIVAFATARTKHERSAARDTILAHEVDRPALTRRLEPPRPGDLPLIAQLTEAHRTLNATHFEGGLQPLPIRLSGRMATRLGHFDPGSRHQGPEIVLSRRHLTRDGWREALHTLLHEMVHQWQHETGQPVDHGPTFREKCRAVGITPAARRDVTPLARRKARAG